MRRLPALLALMLSAVTFAACDSGDEPEPEGTYRAELSGDVEGTFEGPAFFSTVGVPIPEFEDFLTVTLIGPDGRSFFGLGFNGRPEAGSYTLDSEGAETATFLYVDQDQSLQLSGRSGSITITRSTEDRIGGTFRVELSERFLSTDADGMTAQATGSFDAEAQTFRAFAPVSAATSSLQD